MKCWILLAIIYKWVLKITALPKLFSSICWQYFILLRHELSKFKFSNLKLII